MRAKRFELLHKLGLSQSPLPLGYTRVMKNTRGKIWTYTEKFLKLLPLPIGLREQKKLVDWKGFKPLREVCKTSMLSLLHHQPEKVGVEGGIHTRTSLVLTKFRLRKLCASLSVPPLRREKINTDGEIWTHITLFLKQVPLAVGLRRCENSRVQTESIS